VSFSNRCFPTKAFAVWQALSGTDQQRLVTAYMHAAGLTDVANRTFTPAQGDPLWFVTGRAMRVQTEQPAVPDPPDTAG
jgi:hypothetical protein